MTVVLVEMLSIKVLQTDDVLLYILVNYLFNLLLKFAPPFEGLNNNE